MVLETPPKPIVFKTTYYRDTGRNSMRFLNMSKLGRVFNRTPPEPAQEVLEATAAAKVELLRIMAMVRVESKAQRLRDEADHEQERWNDQHRG